MDKDSEHDSERENKELTKISVGLQSRMVTLQKRKKKGKKGE